jgi:pimeloyl-ACP methyl ester carboxylesterase/DNA-binding SARP family transcriptional activator
MRSVGSRPFARPLAPSKSPQLCLLGKPALRTGNRLFPLQLRPKATALLAYLAMEDREAARHDLARLFFADTADPLASLRWHLAHLRAAAPRAVSQRLSATRTGVRLSMPTDGGVFRQHAEACTRRPMTRRVAQALALYRDDFLAGLTVSATAEFDNWLYVTQEGLRRCFRQAALAYARWTLEAGRAREAVAPLARLVTCDPYCEDGHVLLIEAYEALAQTGLATAAYDRYQRIVRRELAAEPRPSLALRFEGRVSEHPSLPRETLIPLQEVTLHVVDWPGASPAIVGIHGSAGMAHTLGALAERLAPAHRFIGVDLRGHGFSDKPPAGYDLDRHVADVRQLIEAMGLRRPLLLGHSAGGTIAACVAGVTDAAGLILLEAMIGDRAFTENAVAQAAPIVVGIDKPAVGFDAYLARWRSRRRRWSDQAERLVERWARFAFAPLPNGTYRQRALRVAVEAEWDSIVAADSLGALARVSCPILIVQARRPWLDGRPYFTRRIVAAQLAAAPAAELFVAEHSDHAMLIRDPEPRMVEAIAEFALRCGRAVAGGRSRLRRRRPATQSTP